MAVEELRGEVARMVQDVHRRVEDFHFESDVLQVLLDAIALKLLNARSALRMAR